MSDDEKFHDKCYTELEYINRFENDDLTDIEEKELFRAAVAIKIAEKAIQKTLSTVENKSDIIALATKIYSRLEAHDALTKNRAVKPED